MDQFNAGDPWDVVPGTPKPTEGHYIPLVGYDPTKDLWYVVTWGQLQAVTSAFILKYADEHYALLSPEMLKGGKSLEGFDLTTLQADLAAVNGAVTPPAPAPTPAPVPDPADVAVAPTLHHLVGLKSTSHTAVAAINEWLKETGL
jgi:hypothetical protein